MMGIGFTEMIFIAGIALVVIGPEKFPDFAKLMIRTIRDLKGYVDEVKVEVGKEFKPLKKEIEALSKIDPEKYIDSLTSEAAPPKPLTSPNMPVNPEDQKIMAEAAAYGEAHADTCDGAGNEAATGAAPEGTVGYGSEAIASDDVTTPEGDATASEANTESLDDDFKDFDNRREPSGTGEPDVWTGR
jgi:sec-independent protein translocase protein TatB